MDYTGPEILTELKINKGKKLGGRIKRTQKIDVKCSRCLTINTVNYDGHARNRLKDSSSPYMCQKCCASNTIRRHNKAITGKSYEELFGIDKAILIKRKLSETSKNRDSIKNLRRFYGLSWEEKYGKEKADALKEHLRQNCKLVPKFGKDNPHFGKPAHKLSGKGTKGYYNDIFFRSLLEASFIHYLFNAGITFENGELEKYKIPYTFEGTQRNYFSDFVTEEYVFEIKPKSLLKTPQNCAKFKAAEIWSKNMNKQYKIMTEDDYHQLSQTEIENLKKEGILRLV